MLANLKEVAKRGYALDEEEFMEGMVAIAVPVTDATGKFVAALAFHGPTQRLSIEGIVEKKGLLQDASKKLQEAVFAD